MLSDSLPPSVLTSLPTSQLEPSLFYISHFISPAPCYSLSSILHLLYLHTFLVSFITWHCVLTAEYLELGISNEETAQRTPQKKVQKECKASITEVCCESVSPRHECINKRGMWATWINFLLWKEKTFVGSHTLDKELEATHDIWEKNN